MFARRHMLTVAIAAAVMLAGPATASAKITKELREQMLPQIMEGLKNKDPLVEANALLASAPLMDRKLAKEVAPFLSNKNEQVRHAAMIALASAKDRKGIAALKEEIVKAKGGRFLLLTEVMPLLPEKVQLGLLKGASSFKKTDASTRADTLRYISLYGSGKIYALLGQVTRLKKADERKQYVDVLLLNPRPEAFGWASKLASNKRDAAARLAGVKLAIAIGGKKLDGLARAALTDKDTKVVDAAVDYFAETKHPLATEALLKRLDRVADGDKAALVRRILELGQKVPYAQAQKLVASAPKDKELNVLYHRLLGASQDKKAIEALKKLERSTEISDRRLGVQGLAASRSREAMDVFLRTLYDGNTEIRLLSIAGLGEIGHDSGVKPLRIALNKTRDKSVKYAIIKALGHIKSAASGKVLMFLVRDNDPKIKALALTSLAAVGDKSTRSVVEVLVDDRNADISWQATLLLLRLDAKAGKAKLARALQRPPTNYIDTLMELPDALRDDVLLTLLAVKNKKVRADALDALMAMGDSGSALVRKVAASKGPFDVRDACTKELLRHTSRKDVGLFKRLAQTGSEEDKMAALLWLARRADPKLTGFFRTQANGAKKSPARKFLAIYGLLKSQA